MYNDIPVVFKQYPGDVQILWNKDWECDLSSNTCPQSANSKKQKRAYTILTCMLSCNSPAHHAFRRKHLDELRKVLLESLSTARASSKKVGGAQE